MTSLPRPPRPTVPPPLIAAVLATFILLATYLATMAPDLTVWDAAELMTAAHTLGIPHPPGTPLWVLYAHVVSQVFSSAGPARAVTMASVLATAATGGLGAMMLTRIIGVRGAVVAAVSAGTMMTVWANATETEVYGAALLASVAMLAIGEFAGRATTPDAQRLRGRAALAFLAGLAIPLHLSVLVALPAAIALAWRGARPRAVDVIGWIALGALGLSSVAVLPLLAAREPALNSGNPDTFERLLAVLQREQYAVAGFWPRKAPWWLQIGNVFQWADWQVAYGLHPRPTPALVRTTLSVLWAWVALIGVRRLWQYDALVGRAMVLLLVSGTMGVALWLNMYAGPSFGVGVLPESAAHEARERDYFFVLAFWTWGLLAGVGLSAVARRLARSLPAPVAILPLVAAAVPLVLNRAVADRSALPGAQLPRTYARLLLEAVPERGILFTAGDNDSFPLWYLQQVEGMREDVTVVVVPLLGATWYRQALANARLFTPASVTTWPGLDAALRDVMARAGREARTVRVSTLLAKVDRDRLDPRAGWRLEGMIFAPAPDAAPGMVLFDAAAMRRAADLVPPSVLDPLPAGSDPALVQLQRLLRCPGMTQRADPLLVSSCSGI